ncbi:MAG: hypothetical protein HYT65_01090, partial [Candidatus Yanofskybacteria bacterium]|nr:hypothetical protein [Candidatus Yanofskybacteria bacterium]
MSFLEKINIPAKLKEKKRNAEKIQVLERRRGELFNVPFGADAKDFKRMYDVVEKLISK